MWVVAWVRKGVWVGAKSITWVGKVARVRKGSERFFVGWENM